VAQTVDPNEMLASTYSVGFAPVTRIKRKIHVISTEDGAFAAAAERPLYFVVVCFTLVQVLMAISLH
jgi:hypothetical protein